MNAQANTPDPAGFTFAAPRLGVLLGSMRRFPYAVAAATLFAAFLIAGVHDLFDLDAAGRLPFGGFAGFFLLLGIGLIAEARQWPRLKQLGVVVVAAVMLAGWLILAGPELGLPHVLLGAALVGFCITAPALAGAGNDALWHFNQQSFYGFGIAGVAVALFQLGIAAISFSVSELFGISGSGKIFIDMSIMVSALFWPLYTITFMPRLPLSEERKPHIPAALAFVLSYVALPVLLLYGIVIAVYGLQVIGLGTAPKSSVGWMVIGFAAAGIALHFLLYPLRERGNLTVRLFWRFFHLLLLPYLGLLFWALALRIGTYGVTEMRYLALLGGIWASGMAVHTAIGRQAFKLGTAPAALAVLLVLAGLGPWSAESIGYASQEVRLANILTRSGLLQGEELRHPAEAPALSWAARRDLSSLLDYFHERRDGRQPGYLASLRNIELQESQNWAAAVMQAWQLGYVAPWQRREEKDDSVPSLTYYAPGMFSTRSQPAAISGYDWLVPFYEYSSTADTYTQVAGLPVGLRVGGRGLKLRIGEQESEVIDVLSMLPQPLEAQSGSINGAALMKEIDAGGAHIRLLIENVSAARQADGSWHTSNLSGYLLVNLPDSAD